MSHDTFAAKADAQAVPVSVVLKAGSVNTNSTNYTIKEIQRFLDQEAGAMEPQFTYNTKKVRVVDDTMSANPRNGFKFGYVCAVCGTATPRRKTCAVCQGVNYCTRECQRVDWATHKLVCKKLHETDVYPLNTEKKVFQWLVCIPESHTHIWRAVQKMDDDCGLFAVCLVAKGANDRNAAFLYPDTKTEADVERLRGSCPEYADVFSVSDEVLPIGIRRVVLVIEAFGTTIVTRARVSEPHVGVGVGVGVGGA